MVLGVMLHDRNKKKTCLWFQKRFFSWQISRCTWPYPISATAFWNWMVSALLELQPRCGEKPVKLQELCLRNGTAVLPGLRHTPKRCIPHVWSARSTAVDHGFPGGICAAQLLRTCSLSGICTAVVRFFHNIAWRKKEDLLRGTIVSRTKYC